MEEMSESKKYLKSLAIIAFTGFAVGFVGGFIALCIGFSF